MQFHSTANAENIQLSAKSRFQRRMRPLAIAAGLVAIVGLSFRARSRRQMNPSHKVRMAIKDALWPRCRGDICSPSPECCFPPHSG